VNELMEKYRDEIERTLDKYPEGLQRSAVMPLLYLAQRREGYVSKQSIQDIAEILDINPTEVASLIGFYTLFYEEPGGRYRIQVCTDIACALRGSEQFFKDLCDYLEIKSGETTSDGLFTIESVMCLAACHHAPMFQVQGDGEISYHENQTLESAKAFIEEVRRKHKQNNPSTEESDT
jgi:NADH-quinone oxidoreductase subunit E